MQVRNVHARAFQTMLAPYKTARMVTTDEYKTARMVTTDEYHAAHQLRPPKPMLNHTYARSAVAAAKPSLSRGSRGRSHQAVDESQQSWS